VKRIPLTVDPHAFPLGMGGTIEKRQLLVKSRADGACVRGDRDDSRASAATQEWIASVHSLDDSDRYRAGGRSDILRTYGALSVPGTVHGGDDKGRGRHLRFMLLKWSHE
jgi:hypothetical protein